MASERRFELKVLLTGAAGDLGSRVFHRLVQGGYDVVGTDIRSPKDPPPGSFVTADLLHQPDVVSLLAGCDAVVHTGNHKWAREDIPPEQTYLENVAMNTHVFQGAYAAGVRCVIYASSIQVISGNRLANNPEEPSCLTRLPLDSHTSPCPGNTYALSKLAGEQMLQCHAFLSPERSYTAIRFPWLIGCSLNDRPKPSGPAKPGRLTQADEAFAYLSMPDAVDMILAVLTKSLPGYHPYLPSAGNSLGLTPAELIQQYYPDVPLEGEPSELESLVDTGLIQAELGWSPRDVGLFSLSPDPA